MKKQNNSVSIMSVKSRISVTVLCALLGATEVNASNYSSVDLNTISKELKADPKNENSANRFTTWTGKINNVAEEEQMIDVITRWMSDSSYWSSEDTLSIEHKVSDNSNKETNSEKSKGNNPGENKPLKINAESYILNSEF
jgi:hypothetical protein